MHLKNIYKEEELDENRTTEFFSVVQNEGQRNVNIKIDDIDIKGTTFKIIHSKNYINSPFSSFNFTLIFPIIFVKEIGCTTQ